MDLEEEMANGIAANDLGSLLEQFLEYEEKQGEVWIAMFPESLSFLPREGGTSLFFPFQGLRESMVLRQGS